MLYTCLTVACYSTRGTHHTENICVECYGDYTCAKLVVSSHFGSAVHITISVKLETTPDSAKRCCSLLNYFSCCCQIFKYTARCLCYISNYLLVTRFCYNQFG